MAVLNVATLSIPASAWNETLETCKKAKGILEGLGAQDVRFITPIAGGAPGGTVHSTFEAPDLASLGKVLDAMYTNQDMIALMARGSELGVTWQSSILAELPLS
jgi:hypothetical protein